MERIGRALLCMAALGLGTVVALIPWPVVGSMTAAALDVLFVQSRDVVFIISTGPGESFFPYLSVAAILGQALAMPVIAYQMLAFVAPKRRSTTKLRAAAASVGLASFAGLVLAYLLIPFLGFAFQPAPNLDPPAQYSAGVVILPSRMGLTPDAYVARVVDVLDVGAFALALPVTLSALTHVGAIGVTQLTDARWYAIGTALVVSAAIVDAPDPVRLATLSLSIYVLFELGIVLARRGLPSFSAVGAIWRVLVSFVTTR